MAGIIGSLVLLVAFVAPAPSQPAQTADTTPQGTRSEKSRGPAQASEHVRNGVQHFERAFYELTPKKQDSEAAREFDLAIAEFKAEAAARPASATAHSYLGRIYSIRKDYRNAATHYDRLSELEPLNVDACVLAALAYAEDGQIAVSRSRLEGARLRTSDPTALARIAEYMSKLDAPKR